MAFEFLVLLKNQYTSLLGGVFLKPDGGSWPAAPIAGSAQISNLFYDYPLGLYYVYLKACSGGAVVEISNGDTVRFQFGFFVEAERTQTELFGFMVRGQIVMRPACR